MSPRIEPLAPREWSREFVESLRAIRPPDPDHPSLQRNSGRPKGLNLLGTFARHPELAAAFQVFSGQMLYGTTLTERQRELLVLRVAARRHAAYEWAQHAVLADDVGISADEIARVVTGPTAPGWSPFESALLTAVDELIDDARIADPTWAALSTELDERQLMDVVFTVGSYEVLAMALRTFGVELDDDLKPWAPNLPT